MNLEFLWRCVLSSIDLLNEKRDEKWNETEGGHILDWRVWVLRKDWSQRSKRSANEVDNSVCLTSDHDREEFLDSVIAEVLYRCNLNPKKYKGYRSQPLLSLQINGVFNN